MKNIEWEILSKFLTLFDHRLTNEGKSFEVLALQNKSLKLVESLQLFIENYKKRYPHFNIILYEFLVKIPDGQYFFILNSKERNTNDLNELWKKLAKIHDEKGIESYDEDKYDWGAITTKYDIQFFGDKGKVFGIELVHEDKYCRFCNTVANTINFSGEIVKFSKKSHTVSEALGNKVLFSKDECDSCNERFSETIEPSIVNFYAPFRSLYGIPGKGGMKTLKGRNFTLHPLKGFDIQYPGLSDDCKETIEMGLILNEKWIPQDVYRCLVKFIVGMLPSSSLENYQETINWINGGKKRYLPKIAVLKQANFYTEKPLLFKYERIVDDCDYPNLIGEFRYGDIIMIFLIPFCTEDKIGFIKEKAFKKFWPIIIGPRSNLNWSFVSFSSEKPKKMKINLKLEGIKIGENTFIQQVEH